MNKEYYTNAVDDNGKPLFTEEEISIIEMHITESSKIAKQIKRLEAELEALSKTTGLSVTSGIDSYISGQPKKQWSSDQNEVLYDDFSPPEVSDRWVNSYDY